MFEHINQEDKIRLDHFLTRNHPEISRSKIQKIIKSGQVRINEELILSPHCFLRDGDRVSCDIEAYNLELLTENESSEVPIIFEDEHILVINKPAGMMAHAFGQGDDIGSLVGFLKKRYPEIGVIGDNPARPGIVHRLDKDVSGLMIVAKTDLAFYSLKRQFQDRSIVKEYQALVYGVPENPIGAINFRIGRSSATKSRMIAYPVNFELGKEALTEYELIGVYRQCSLLRVLIKTGRTHQIRAHMHALGYPIVGDRVYKSRHVKSSVNCNRMFLHSSVLAFSHPTTGQMMRFELSLPRELKDFLYGLGDKKKIVLVSGPSGAGKTSLIKSFLTKNSNQFGLATTYTTRPKRTKTPEDKIMHNVTQDEFDRLRDAGEFMEWSEFNGYGYATHRESVLKTLEQRHLLINIDVLGARQILRSMPECYAVFIDVHDERAVRDRLIKRGDVQPESIEERLLLATRDRSFKSLYDEVIYNDETLEKAFGVFEKLVLSLIEK